MKAVLLDTVNREFDEKIQKLSQARQEALRTYNTRDYVTLSHLIDALNSTRDFVNLLPTVSVDVS